MSDAVILRFGSFELHSEPRELRHNGDLVKLPPQPFKVLEILARKGGQVVTRTEIREQVWCGDTFVDFEQGLNFCIRQIREALGDTAGAPRIIETLPKRGYRLLMPVTSGAPAQPERLTRLIVLPFRMLRPDSETEFLAFSLPDALTASLSALKKLVVRSSMAAAKFGADADLKTVAAGADVDVIVTGTLLRAGDEGEGDNANDGLCRRNSARVTFRANATGKSFSYGRRAHRTNRCFARFAAHRR